MAFAWLLGYYALDKRVGRERIVTEDNGGPAEKTESSKLVSHMFSVT